ncbi:MAG: fatty acid desaturase [Alcanivoracaceae bacterium]|nr:fatty acid desaturase [Alcanivoracaceae bacterium]
MSTTIDCATANAADKALDKKIQRELIGVSDEVRARHSWLQHQDAIGLSIFIVSIAGCIINAWLYVQGVMPAWAVILGTAFWTSLLHELEHDLIHWMYFKKNKLVHQLMMAGVYLFRPFTANPWVRRHLHFHHHKNSGTQTDIEERGITNGEKWGLRRFIMVGDNMLAVYLRAKKYLTEPSRLYREGKVTKQDLKHFRLISLLTYQPLGVISHTLWHGFILFHVANGVAWLFGAQIPWPTLLLEQMPWITTLAVVLFAPNALRTFCLHFISSNMHYYGDNKPGFIVEQCQVMNVWWLAPLQLFCFNFGTTHAIHHFVVRDPFYIRQMTASKALPILKANGVRFNDMGTFKRANRMHTQKQTSQNSAPVAA